MYFFDFSVSNIPMVSHPLSKNLDGFSLGTTACDSFVLILQFRFTLLMITLTFPLLCFMSVYLSDIGMMIYCLCT